ncbi:MAG: DUF2812 domain-containing protein, partial [Ruminiclostridium sp.]
RNKFLLTLAVIGLAIELLCIGNIIWDVYKFPSNSLIATTCIFISFIIAFFAFAITSLAMQISKFSKKNL